MYYYYYYCYYYMYYYYYYYYYYFRGSCEKQAKVPASGSPYPSAQAALLPSRGFRRSRSEGTQAPESRSWAQITQHQNMYSERYWQIAAESAISRPRLSHLAVLSAAQAAGRVAGVALGAGLPPPRPEGMPLDRRALRSALQRERGLRPEGRRKAEPRRWRPVVRCPGGTRDSPTLCTVSRVDTITCC